MSDVGIDDKRKHPEPTLDPDDGAAAGGGESEGGLDAKKIVLFVILPLFALVGIGGGLYFTGTLDKLLGGKGEEQHAEADAGRDQRKAGKTTASAHSAYFLEIPNMVVNLNTDGETRYLRLSVQLELSNPGDVQAIEGVMPRVVDQFQTYLRELRVRDLRGSQGIYRLQMELLARVNAAAYPVEVKDVLFQEILIQ